MTLLVAFGETARKHRRLADDNGQLLRTLREMTSLATDLRLAYTVAVLPGATDIPEWLREAERLVVRAEATLQKYGF